MFLSDRLQIFHTTHPVVPFGDIWTLTYFWFSTMTYLNVLKRTLFPEQISKTTGPITYCHIAHTWSLRSLELCAFSSFWTLKLTQHFDLIYNISKSDSNILRNIMKTTQDSYTITIKQFVRFQERMHLEKFQFDKIWNFIYLEIFDSIKFKMATYQPLFNFTWPIFGKPC